MKLFSKEQLINKYLVKIPEKLVERINELLVQAIQQEQTKVSINLEEYALTKDQTDMLQIKLEQAGYENHLDYDYDVRANPYAMPCRVPSLTVLTIEVITEEDEVWTMK